MRKIITPDLGIELTQKCNLNCSHCFRGAARNRNISKEIIEKVFDEIKYIQTLDLSGGEVFLGYEQLKTLLETANQKGTTIESCNMLTNGTIYDGRIYELLDEYFGKNYQVGISDDDFHDKSIKRIYRENLEDSENPDLHPKSIKDVKNNMYRHFINEHCIGFQRVSKHLINNGRAVNTKTPHKDFEAMGYYFNSINPTALLVGPMIFIGADGFISDINSDLDKRREQSLGNIKENSIANLVMQGGIKIDCKDVVEFFELMQKRENDFGTHQGDHLVFKNGKMEHVEYKRDEEYNKAIEEMPAFFDRAYKVILEENIDEFVKNDEYFKIHPDDISQIDHEDYDDERQ